MEQRKSRRLARKRNLPCLGMSIPLPRESRVSEWTFQLASQFLGKLQQSFMKGLLNFVGMSAVSAQQRGKYKPAGSYS